MTPDDAQQRQQQCARCGRQLRSESPDGLCRSLPEPAGRGPGWRVWELQRAHVSYTMTALGGEWLWRQPPANGRIYRWWSITRGRARELFELEVCLDTAGGAWTIWESAT